MKIKLTIFFWLVTIQLFSQKYDNINVKDTITANYLRLRPKSVLPSSPGEGKMIYYNDTLRVYNGSSWVKIGSIYSGKVYITLDGDSFKLDTTNLKLWIAQKTKQDTSYYSYNTDSSVYSTVYQNSLKASKVQLHDSTQMLLDSIQTRKFKNDSTNSITGYTTLYQNSLKSSLAQLHDSTQMLLDSIQIKEYKSDTLYPNGHVHQWKVRNDSSYLKEQINLSIKYTDTLGVSPLINSGQDLRDSINAIKTIINDTVSIFSLVYSKAATSALIEDSLTDFHHTIKTAKNIEGDTIKATGNIFGKKHYNGSVIVKDSALATIGEMVDSISNIIHDSLQNSNLTAGQNITIVNNKIRLGVDGEGGSDNLIMIDPQSSYGDAGESQFSLGINRPFKTIGIYAMNAFNVNVRDSNFLYIWGSFFAEKPYVGFTSSKYDNSKFVRVQTDTANMCFSIDSKDSTKLLFKNDGTAEHSIFSKAGNLIVRSIRNLTGESKIFSVLDSTEEKLYVKKDSTIINNILNVNNKIFGYNNDGTDAAIYGWGQNNAVGIIGEAANGIGGITTSETGIGFVSASQDSFGSYVQSTNNIALRVSGDNHKKIVSVVKGTGVGIVEAFYIDTFGYVHNDIPHALSQFNDSSVTITLTQNVWAQITNSWKSLWPSTEYTGFTESSDTLIIGLNGDFSAKWQINLLGVDSKDYEYRMMKRRGATTTVLWHYNITSGGKAALRTIDHYIEDAEIGDRIWVELRSTSTSPGNVVIYNGEMIVTTIHLDL